MHNNHQLLAIIIGLWICSLADISSTAHLFAPGLQAVMHKMICSSNDDREANSFTGPEYDVCDALQGLIQRFRKQGDSALFNRQLNEQCGHHQP